MSGGAAGRDLLLASGRHAVRRALEAGLVVRVGRGRYALPLAAAALGVAHGLAGALSHVAAARYWGWEVPVSIFTGDRWVRPDLLDDPRGLAIEAESSPGKATADT